MRRCPPVARGPRLRRRNSAAPALPPLRAAHLFPCAALREATMTIRWNPFLRASLLAAVALGLACSERPDPAAPVVAADVAAPAATQATGYSGRAAVVQATLLTPVSTTVTLVDAGPLPASGGAMEASLLSANEPGLVTANVLHATTVGQGNASRSEASVADVALSVAGNTISAGFLQARATAVCTDAGGAATGSSDIANVLHATTVGQGNASRSEASVADVAW